MCPDGMAGLHDVRDPDARWPEENPMDAVGIKLGRDANGGDMFNLGFHLGLQLGARIGSDPLKRPLVEDILKKCADGVAEAYSDEEAA